ncbi:Cation efflux system protein CusC precursor [compost metagenome]
MQRLSLLLGATLFGLAGCVRLGPDFESPREDWPEQWRSTALAQSTEQRSSAEDVQWWRQFGDPQLDRLIAEAEAGNSSLRIAGLRVLEARAQLSIARSGRYPQVQQASADAFYLDSHQSGGDLPVDRHLWQYSGGFDIAWELDFWGRFARAIESADAAYFASQANYQDALVLLRAQVADTYFTLRTAEARLRIALDNAAKQKRSYDITERLFRSGNDAELDLQQAKTQYLGTLSTIPDFESQLARTRNALSVLLGRPPGALSELGEQDGLIPLPERAQLNDVPVRLLLRRPDVRAAEWSVAAQSAQIGVATTDLYPSIALLGSLVWTGTSLDGSSVTRDLLGGPSLVWNLFDHGRIEGNILTQDARLQQLIEAYRDTVRRAAQEADDAATGLLKALERDRILGEAESAAQRSLELASAQYREGYSDFQRVLDAQRALLFQQDTYLVNRSSAVSNLIALYRALGGGWQSTQDPLGAATRAQMQKRSDWGELLDTAYPPRREDSPDER